MDLEKIKTSEKIFKSSGFRLSKKHNFYYIAIPIFIKQFMDRVVHSPVDEELFWKKWRCQNFDLKQKKFNLKKK